MQEESQISLQKEIIPAFPEEVKSPEYQIPQKNNNLLIYLIAILIFFGILGFLGWKYVFGEKIINQFFPTPTPTIQVAATPTVTIDPTASWKTYINNTSAYSLKYPLSWNFFESDQLLGNGEISDTKWNLSTTNDVPNIRIVVYKSDSSFPKSITAGGTQAIIDGKTATKNVTEGKTFTVDYRVSNAVNTYFIDLEVASKQELNQYESLFDQILSTFKFVEKSTDISVTPSATGSACLKENESAIFAQTIKCCEGLKSTSGEFQQPDGTCTVISTGGFSCINCGNGVCGLGENKCNCPADCK